MAAASGTLRSTGRWRAEVGAVLTDWPPWATTTTPLTEVTRNHTLGPRRLIRAGGPDLDRRPFEQILCREIRLPNRSFMCSNSGMGAAGRRPAGPQA